MAEYVITATTLSYSGITFNILPGGSQTGVLNPGYDYTDTISFGIYQIASVSTNFTANLYRRAPGSGIWQAAGSGAYTSGVAGNKTINITPSLTFNGGYAMKIELSDNT